MVDEEDELWRNVMSWWADIPVVVITEDELWIGF